MAFADTLRTKMNERDFSVRKLAATWRPSNPESARRSLNKYLLEGQEPTDRIAAELAEVLDVPVEQLTEDGDQEDEEDPVALLRDLMARVESVIAQQEMSTKRGRRRIAA